MFSACPATMPLSISTLTERLRRETQKAMAFALN